MEVDDLSQGKESEFRQAFERTLHRSNEASSQHSAWQSKRAEHGGLIVSDQRYSDAKSRPSKDWVIETAVLPMNGILKDVTGWWSTELINAREPKLLDPWCWDRAATLDDALVCLGTIHDVVIPSVPPLLSHRNGLSNEESAKEEYYLQLLKQVVPGAIPCQGVLRTLKEADKARIGVLLKMVRRHFHGPVDGANRYMRNSDSTSGSGGPTVFRSGQLSPDWKTEIAQRVVEWVRKPLILALFRKHCVKFQGEIIKDRARLERWNGRRKEFCERGLSTLVDFKQRDDESERLSNDPEGMEATRPLEDTEKTWMWDYYLTHPSSEDLGRLGEPPSGSMLADFSCWVPPELALASSPKLTVPELFTRFFEAFPLCSSLGTSIEPGPASISEKYATLAGIHDALFADRSAIDEWKSINCNHYSDKPRRKGFVAVTRKQAGKNVQAFVRDLPDSAASQAPIDSPPPPKAVDPLLAGKIIIQQTKVIHHHSYFLPNADLGHETPVRTALVAKPTTPGVPANREHNELGPARDFGGAGADIGPELKAVEPINVDNPNSISKKKEPKPAERMAVASYEWVCHKRPDLMPTKGGQKYSKEQWEYIRDHDCPAYHDQATGRSFAVPDFETWKRYVRGGQYDPEEPKATSRAGRRHGKSIVQADQV